MSDFPLYDVLCAHPEPALSPMAEYRRGAGRPFAEVEARRKAELRTILTDFLAGRRHPVLTVLAALETVLSAHTHPLHYLPEAAHDPNSFQDYLNGGEKKLDPEAFQLARRRHIHNQACEDFGLRHQAAPYVLSGDGSLWATQILADLDRPDARSVDIVRRIAGNFMRRRGGYGRSAGYDDPQARFGLSAVNRQLDALRSEEDKDNLVHPNDPCQQGDLFEVLAAFRWPSMVDSRTRDDYQTREDVELRRAMEICAVLRQWKAGAIHPLLAMAQALISVMETFESPFVHLLGEADQTVKNMAAWQKHVGSEDEASRERYLARLNRDVDSCRREAREIFRQMRFEVAAYRGEESNPELAAQIDSLIERLESEGELASSVVKDMAEILFAPLPEDLPGETLLKMHQRPMLTRIRHAIAETQAEQEAKWEAARPMGPLRTQTIEEIMEPLRAIFQERAETKDKPDYKPPARLTEQILIEPAGAGMVKPFKGPEEDDSDESFYGTVVARITTYAVTLVPRNPSQIEELADRVRWALDQIAEIEPAFRSPFDTASEPYERPVSDEYVKHRRVKYSAMRSRHVTIMDGKVMVYTRLDLDDVWNLYYLLQDIIEPSEQIATAMNVARYAEERGVLLSKGNVGGVYSNANRKPEEQMGSLSEVAPEDYIPAAIRDTLALYALGEIGIDQLVQRAMILADHTLAGRMAHPAGLLPAFNRLAGPGGKEGGRAVIRYEEALKERTRDILMLMTGTSGRDRPLYPALIARAAEICRPLRARLHGQARRAEEALQRKFSRHGDPRDPLEEWLQEAMSEPEPAGGAPARGWFDSGDKEQRALARRTNLALRPEVGATTDRTWRGTSYVSRSRNSAWVRKELPPELEALLPRAHARPDMRRTLLALTHEGN